MTTKDIAKLIPKEYRKEILHTNLIARATANAADPGMFYLFTIWKNYVEPGTILDFGCGLCIERILRNYRELQPVLLEMEKQSNLLAEL